MMAARSSEPDVLALDRSAGVEFDDVQQAESSGRPRPRCRTACPAPCRATVDLLVNAPPLTIANVGNYLAIQSSGGSSTISIDRDGTGGD